jgi:hypothetical protein
MGSSASKGDDRVMDALGGAALLVLGLLLGGGVVWLIERWHDGERQLLFNQLGRLQQEIEDQASIPEEER